MHEKEIGMELFIIPASFAYILACCVFLLARNIRHMKEFIFFVNSTKLSYVAFKIAKNENLKYRNAIMICFVCEKPL